MMVNERTHSMLSFLLELMSGVNSLILRTF